MLFYFCTNTFVVLFYCLFFDFSSPFYFPSFPFCLPKNYRTSSEDVSKKCGSGWLFDTVEAISAFYITAVFLSL